MIRLQFLLPIIPNPYCYIQLIRLEIVRVQCEFWNTYVCYALKKVYVMTYQCIVASNLQDR